MITNSAIVYKIFVDGGARGNPGESGVGIVIDMVAPMLRVNSYPSSSGSCLIQQLRLSSSSMGKILVTLRHNSWTPENRTASLPR